MEDAGLSVGRATIPEAWLFSSLVVPALVHTIRWTAPKVPHVPLSRRTVPAVGLPWELEMASGRAALFTVPSSLVYGESVAPLLVGQAPHAAPDPDRAGWRKLDEMIQAIRVGSWVAWVGLHFAVCASGLVYTGRLHIVFLHFSAVLEYLLEAHILTIFTVFATRPLFWELVV